MVFLIGGSLIEHYELFNPLDQIPIANVDDESGASIPWIADLNREGYLGNQTAHNIGKPAQIKPLPTESLPAKWTVISMAIEEQDLYSREKGILANSWARGREWERLAYFSIYHDKELIHSTAVGVRMHGEISRSYGNKFFRAFFRKAYGSSELPSGILLPELDKPIKRLVIRKDPDWPFMSAFTTDISLRLGAQAPLTEPILLFINGEPEGVYSLSEHLGKTQWDAHMGHDNYIMRRNKGFSETQENERIFREFQSWVYEHKFDMTYDMAAEKIDMMNFIDHMFAFIFCDTGDALQGAAMLDKENPDAKWYWVNWDLDGSFRVVTSESSAYKDLGWADVRIEATEDNPIWELYSGDPRKVLLYALSKDDKFVKVFTERIMYLMNHRINNTFLQNLVNHFAELGEENGLDNMEFENKLRAYLKVRPQIVRNQMLGYYKVGPVHQILIAADPELNLRVDDRAIDRNYEGWYMNNMPLTIMISPEEDTTFTHWKINGEIIPLGNIVVKVRNKMLIQAIRKPL